MTGRGGCASDGEPRTRIVGLTGNPRPESRTLFLARTLTRELARAIPGTGPGPGLFVLESEVESFGEFAAGWADVHAGVLLAASRASAAAWSPREERRDHPALTPARGPSTERNLP